jgi:predicted TIM-barrel fold metal-dependent hydrolase
MSKTAYYLKHQSKPSASAKIRSQLGHPVIDTDVHTIEYTPLLEEYIAQEGGSAAVDQFRHALSRGYGLLANDWYGQSWDERRYHHSARPAWWALPSKNTLDLATVTLPELLNERLHEAGIDYAVLYPNISTLAPHIGNPELRRVIVRAVNRFNADIFRPYADRVTPVAAIPLHTPEEGIEELDYAINTLGLKVALIPGYVVRPIKAFADQYPREQHPELAKHLTRIDTYGIDSEHDYDPFWAKAVELKTVLTTHSVGMGWTARSSFSNYMYNHIGHFADASHALAKSLFFGGVTDRFPDLRVGLLEGGAAWGVNLYADLISHWEKRNGKSIENYDPAQVNQELLLELFKQYGNDITKGKELSAEALSIGGALGRSNNSHPQDAGFLDDFAAANIKSIEDIKAKFVPNFYFGAEADDPTVAYAFNDKANPLNTKLNAFWASDTGHWDVPDLTEVLADSWRLVENGALTKKDFKDLVFNNPYNFYAGKNPEFFKGTQIDAITQKKAA